MGKQLLIWVLCLFSLAASAQDYSDSGIISNQGSKLPGIYYNRVQVPRTLMIPSRCGAPTGIADLLWKNENMPALVYDTCNKKLYAFNPHDSTWTSISPTGGGGTVTLVSSGNIVGFATVNVANGATTPTFTFSLVSAPAHSYFGNNTSSSMAPGYYQPSLSDLVGVDTTGQIEGYTLARTGSGYTFKPGIAGQPTGTTSYFVEDSTNTPPVSFPADIDTVYYLIGGSPTGIWTGNANKIAVYVNGVFDSYITGTLGDYAFTLDDKFFHRFNGTTWPLTTDKFSWNTDGSNLGGGILGTNSGLIRIKYGGTDKIRIGGNVTFPTITGAGNGVMGLNTAGTARNLQAGYGMTIGTTTLQPDSTIFTTKDSRKKLADSLGALIGSSGGGLQSVLTTDPALTLDNTITFAGKALNYTGARQIVNLSDSGRVVYTNSYSINGTGPLGLYSNGTVELRGLKSDVGATDTARSGLYVGTVLTHGWKADPTGLYSPGLTSAPQTDSVITFNTTTKKVGYKSITGGGVTSITAADATLTISPTTGAAIAGLNLATANTWTGVPTVSKASVGTGTTSGLILVNPTSAAAAAQQYSPVFKIGGQGWKTATTAASQSIDFTLQAVPVQGSASPTGYLDFMGYINGAASSAHNVISTLGYHGINTINPQRYLHAVGASGAVASFPSIGASDVAIFENATNANIGLVAATSGIAALKFYKSGASGESGSIQYNLANDTILLYAGASALKMAASSGDVVAPGNIKTGTLILDRTNTRIGIGTLTPEKQLDIVGPSGAPTAPTLGAADFVVFRNNGNGNIAFVTGATSTAVFKFYKPGGASSAGQFGFNNNSDQLRFGVGTTSIDAASDMLVGSNHYVGIGTNTTNAHSMLQVVGSLSANYRAITGARTLDGTDYTVDCTAGTFTVTLPTAVGITGRIYNVTNTGAGVITIATTSSQTFANVPATPTTLTLSSIGNYQVQSTGAGWIVL